ncbi:ImmA/IrrE family metallo-endopeptidase [Leuconostoc citreum]|uniref:ImmA/IrrE family metallo-endopeptidase n=1 Tax=Leuconostoc citreum TaxID=33964 RepID=UPI0032DE4E32
MLEEELDTYNYLYNISNTLITEIEIKKNTTYQNIKWYTIINYMQENHPIVIKPIKNNFKLISETNFGLYGATMTLGNQTFIQYNDKNIKQRQNFTIMHEISHYLLHQNNTYVSLMNENNYSEADLIKEREANMLAGMLLINKKILIQLLHDRKPFNYLKKYFNVSTQALDKSLFNHFYFQTIAQILNEEKAIDKPYIYCRKTINNYRYNNHQLIIK